MNRTLALALVSSLALTACAGMPGKASSLKGGNGSDGKSSVAGAIASAAQDAADEGNTTDALAFQQKLYYGDPHNPDYILSYAKALRHAGKINDALLVIRTPAKEKRAGEPLKTEAAMVLISAGQYDEAMEFAQAALEKSDKSPYAHQALALAMSGLNKNAEAQAQFERALDLWPDNEDKTPIINNLAMSLAAQGKITEARNVMSQATGEALKSEVYQNNRAMLDTLKDRDIVVSPITPVKNSTTVTTMAPVTTSETMNVVTTSVSPIKGKKGAKPTPAPAYTGKMRPIVQ